VTHDARRSRVGLALVATLAVAVTAATASGGGVPAWDRALLDAINGLPDGLDVVEVPMQLGGLGLLPFVAVLLGVVTGRVPAALAVASAEIGAWLVANRLKELVERARPAALLDGVHVRADASGLGYPSSHAAVAAAAATIAFVWLPARHRWAPVALAVVVAFARVFTGVHFPLDVIGGAAIGVAVGALVDLVPGVRSPR
jgi:undecaprenyl-diphosphatase